MEQKEPGAAEKAAMLVSQFEKSFLHICPTFHPAALPGEIAGKSSNVAFAASHITEVRHPALAGDSCNVIITVMDGKLAISSKALLTSQPIPIYRRTTLAKSAVCITCIRPRQIARYTAAR